MLSRTAQTVRDEAKFGRADGFERSSLRTQLTKTGAPSLLEDQKYCQPQTRNNASPPRTLALVRQSGLNEPFEERVRLIRFALKLGMILAGQEVGMIAQLD